MRNRYFTPNNLIMLGGDMSLAWNLTEGEYLPKPADPEELLDLDMQPVTEDIVGPALVQVRYCEDVPDGERGACKIVVLKRPGCDCGHCEATIALHGRLLLMPERVLKQRLGDMAKEACDKWGRDCGQKSDVPEIIAFQFLMCLGASMLPWSEGESGDFPPTLDEFFRRYGPDGLTLGSAGPDEGFAEETEESIRDHVAGVREFMDNLATGKDDLDQTGEGLHQNLLTDIFSGGAISHVGLDREEALVQMKKDAEAIHGNGGAPEGGQQPDLGQGDPSLN
jgi:hypothetical protein